MTSGTSGWLTGVQNMEAARLVSTSHIKLSKKSILLVQPTILKFRANLSEVICNICTSYFLKNLFMLSLQSKERHTVNNFVFKIRLSKK
jgi:hypothetical protein